MPVRRAVLARPLVTAPRSSASWPPRDRPLLRLPPLRRRRDAALTSCRSRCSLTGTLGAVIGIREPFPTARALFDIAIAGPLARLRRRWYRCCRRHALVDTWSPSRRTRQATRLGEPLLFRLAAGCMFGHIRDGSLVNIHPIAFAAWFGMLATALNLLPFGQLDGGHLTYATLGERSTLLLVRHRRRARSGCASSSVQLDRDGRLMMLVMLFVLGPRHPRVIDEDDCRSTARAVACSVAVRAVLIVRASASRRCRSRPD